MKVSMDRAAARLRSLTLEHWLMVLASALVLLLLAQAMHYARVDLLVQGLEAALSDDDQSAVKRTDVPDLKEYDRITELGHLGSAPKPQLVGIIGDSALFGTSPASASPHAVGSTVTGLGKVIEISVNTVVVEKDGKRTTLTVFPKLTMSVPKTPPQPSGAASTSQPRKPSAPGQGRGTPASEGRPGAAASSEAGEGTERKEPPQ